MTRTEALLKSFSSLHFSFCFLFLLASSYIVVCGPSRACMRWHVCVLCVLCGVWCVEGVKVLTPQQHPHDGETKKRCTLLSRPFSTHIHHYHVDKKKPHGRGPTPPVCPSRLQCKYMITYIVVCLCFSIVLGSSLFAAIQGTHTLSLSPKANHSSHHRTAGQITASRNGEERARSLTQPSALLLPASSPLR